MLDKISRLLRTGERTNIELAYKISRSQGLNLWPLERGIKDILYKAKTQPSVDWENMPLGQLCWLMNDIIALEIKEARFDVFPNELHFFKNLVILELVNTPLPVFPEAILTLTRLKSLSLRNCGLTHIPEALKQLPNLEHLHLQENPNLVYDAKDWTHLKSLTV